MPCSAPVPRMGLPPRTPGLHHESDPGWLPPPPLPGCIDLLTFTNLRLQAKRNQHGGGVAGGERAENKVSPFMRSARRVGPSPACRRAGAGAGHASSPAAGQLATQPNARVQFGVHRLHRYAVKGPGAFQGRSGQPLAPPQDAFSTRQPAPRPR